jgi:hypothetical protein
MKASGHIHLYTLGNGSWYPQNRRLVRLWVVLDNVEKKKFSCLY